MKLLRKPKKNKDPYGNTIGTKYNVYNAETGEIYQRNITMVWGKGFTIDDKHLED